jgi:hypothetical protein
MVAGEGQDWRRALKIHVPEKWDGKGERRVVFVAKVNQERDRFIGLNEDEVLADFDAWRKTDGA